MCLLVSQSNPKTLNPYSVSEIGERKEGQLFFICHTNGDGVPKLGTYRERDGLSQGKE